MAIYRLLQGLTFGPEEIACMTCVYEDVLRLLKLVNRSDPLTEIIARKIVQIVKTGQTDPARMLARTLNRLEIPGGE